TGRRGEARVRRRTVALLDPSAPGWSDAREGLSILDDFEQRGLLAEQVGTRAGDVAHDDVVEPSRVADGFDGCGHSFPLLGERALEADDQLPRADHGARHERTLEHSERIVTE